MDNDKIAGATGNAASEASGSAREASGVVQNLRGQGKVRRARCWRNRK